jgi:flagellar biogenesis protein FliO
MLPRMATMGLMCGALVLAVTALAESPASQPAVNPVNLPPDVDPWSSPEIAAPAMDEKPLLRSNNSQTYQAMAGSDEGGSASWLRTTLALGGVVGLIILLGWGYRRLAEGGGGLSLAWGRRNAVVIEVVGRTALSPRQSVCLVRVGPRLVLLGCTPGAVQSLDVISDGEVVSQLLGQAAQQRGDSHAAAFSKVLVEQESTFDTLVDDATEQETEELAPDDLRLGNVQDSLSGTLKRLKSVLARAS